MQYAPVKVIGGAERCVRLIDGLVGRLGLALSSHHLAQCLRGTVLLVIDGALRLSTDTCEGDRSCTATSRSRSRFYACDAELRIEIQRRERGPTQLGVFGFGQAVQNAWREYA